MPHNSNGSKWIRPEKRLAIYCRDQFACVYCSRNGYRRRIGNADGGAILTLDHLVADGGNKATNLVTCCRICNSSRKALTTRQWFARLRERGTDTVEIRQRIRRLTRRNLDRYRKVAKTLDPQFVDDLRQRASQSWKEEHLYG
jgi:hypothetical protein